MGVGQPQASARPLSVSGAGAGAPGDGDRARRARRLPRARVPRLVPGGRAARRRRDAERGGAESASRRHPRPEHEFLLPQGGARRRHDVRRAHPGGRAHRLEADHGAGARRVAGAGSDGVRVVVLYDPGADDWTADDVAAVMKAVDEIAAIFVGLGHHVQKLPVRHDCRWLAACRRADLVFNLCEGVHGVALWEDHVAAMLEFAGIPFTGCGSWTLAMCRRKAVANTLLAQEGLPVPRWMLARGTIPDDFPLPAIVKPAAEDASAGLDRGSVVSDRKTLRSRVAAMTERYDEVLVQEYVAGREFNVGFVGTRALPVAEIDFTGMSEGHWPILTYAAKWDVGSAEDLGSVPVVPALVAQRLAERLVRVATRAWEVVQGPEGVGGGYGRVDLRVDEQGRPWVLDVNPNPDLTDDAGLSRMAQAAGWEYAELIRRMAELALREAQGTKAARELLAASPAPRRARAPRTA